MALMMSCAAAVGSGAPGVGVRAAHRAGGRGAAAGLPLTLGGGERLGGSSSSSSSLVRLGAGGRRSFAEGAVRLAAAADGAAAVSEGAAAGAGARSTGGSKVPLSKQGNVAPGETSPLPTLEGAYAVIEAGGAQLIVQEGRYYDVDRMEAEGGDVVTFNRVLLRRNASGDYAMGAPYIEGAAVQAEVLHDLRGEKIIVQKMKPKKGYRRKRGHRSDFTRLLVTKIN